METSYYIIAYLVASIACGIAGSYRKIGPVAGFFAGLLLSPVFGMGVILASDSKADDEHRKMIVKLLQKENPSAAE